MTPDLIQLRAEQTVGDAVAELRRRAEELPLVYEFFVVDAAGRLQGFCTLRDLVLHEASTPLGQLVREVPATLLVDDKLHDVAGVAAKYNLVSVPVLDHAGVLVGMVTVDDILAEVVDAG
jgi:magnesium transporter